MSAHSGTCLSLIFRHSQVKQLGMLGFVDYLMLSFWSKLSKLQLVLLIHMMIAWICMQRIMFNNHL